MSDIITREDFVNITRAALKDVCAMFDSEAAQELAKFADMASSEELVALVYTGGKVISDDVYATVKAVIQDSELYPIIEPYSTIIDANILGVETKDVAIITDNIQEELKIIKNYISETLAKDWKGAKAGAEKALSKINSLMGNVKTRNTILGVAAAVALIALIARIIYRIRNADAIRACSNLSGREYKICFYTAKKIAQAAKVKTLKDKVKFCKQSKYPKACEEKIKKLIVKAQEKLANIENKLSDLKAAG